MENNDFAWAMKELHNGSMLRRVGWNGKNMFIYLVPGSKFVVNRVLLNKIFPEGTEITYKPHIDMRYADGECGVWLPAQPDILGTDWVVVTDTPYCMPKVGSD